MTETRSRKLSRRDAIKILGAAVGASVLANLPSKWSTPELTSGVLPAHAQTSTQTSQCFALSIVVTAATGDTIFDIYFPSPDLDTATPTAYALGSGLFWNCGSGCIQYQVDTGGPLQLQLTTLGHAPIFFTFPSVPRYILVDRATGDYALDNQLPAPGNCSWGT